jgi:hypothetical protein
VVEERLELVADRRENRRGERGPAPGNASGPGRATCLVWFRQAGSASRLRFDSNRKPRRLEPPSSSSHTVRALEEPLRGPRRPVLHQPRPDTASRPRGTDNASHGRRDDWSVPRRRYSSVEDPGRLDSRKQATEVKAPDDLHDALALSTLVGVSKRKQRRPSRDAARIGSEKRRLRRRIPCTRGSRRR